MVTIGKTGEPWKRVGRTVAGHESESAAAAERCYIMPRHTNGVGVLQETLKLFGNAGAAAQFVGGIVVVRRPASLYVQREP